MERQFDVIVVGAGLIGAFCALSLARQSNLKIALVERSQALPAEHPRNQRVVALGPFASRQLSELGVFQTLIPEAAHGYHTMTVWDAASEGELCFCASDYAQPVLGYMVDSLACTRGLQLAIDQQDNIQTFYGFNATGLDNSRAGATVHGAEYSLSAQLLVAADGANSWVRKQAKIFSQRYSFEQSAIVCKIMTERSHRDTAWQCFLNTGPVAALPLAENSSSVVWSLDDTALQGLRGLVVDDFAKRLAEALGGRLGAVELQGSRLEFALHSQRAERYYSGSIVLVGDAAHSIHPLAGQGANLGFKDAASLIALLINEATDKLFNPAMLARYQRRRKPDNEQTDWLMRALNQAYRNNGDWWQKLRGKGMNWLSEAEPVKATLARHAMGLDDYQ